MPSYAEKRLLPYSPDQLFDLVADVQDYPSFIPWCQAARIRHSGPSMIVADLQIGFGPFRESFTSHVDLDRPKSVIVRAVEGPLEHLTNQWLFAPSDGRTQIDFAIDFAFKSHLLDHVASAAFHEASIRTLGAFESRAHAVFAAHAAHPAPRRSE